MTMARSARRTVAAVAALGAIVSFGTAATAAGKGDARAADARATDARAADHPTRPARFLVGTAAVVINPNSPVTMAAYDTYRVSTGVQPGHPLMARSIAISSQDGSLAHTVVLTVLDSQGYFLAYKEDPLLEPGYFGTAGIRAQVQQDTGLDVEHVIVSTTHTHNSPDSIGVWGGGEDPRNEAYLQVVRDGSIRSIEEALRNRQPATFQFGYADARQYLGTLGQVNSDPKDYPVDRFIRVLQARNRAGAVVATVVGFGAHATVTSSMTTLTPDWPGEVAQDLDARWGVGTTIVVPGAVGRTQPSIPNLPAGTDWQHKLALYASLLEGRIDAALQRVRPLFDGTVAATGGSWTQPITNPAMVALFASKSIAPGIIGGTMRSNLPPYFTGGTVSTDLNALRIGDLFFGGSPGEAYPEIQTELQARITPPAVCGDRFHVFGLSMTNDQIGYTPTLDEYYIALQYTGDEGIFTANPNIGDDNINQQLANARHLGFPTGPDYNGATDGPLVPPPDQYTSPPPYSDQAGPAPHCLPSADANDG